MSATPVTDQAIQDAIESSIRVLAALQVGQQPKPAELKATVDECRMARLILIRRKENGGR